MKKHRKAIYKPKKFNNSKLTAILFGIIGVLIIIKLFSILNYDSFYSVYPQMNKNQINLVYESEILGEKGIIEKDNEIYIPVNTIKETFDPYIYINDDMESITITTADHVIKMRNKESTYFVNDEELSLSLPLYTIDGTSYLPINILEEIYGIATDYNPDTKILSIDNKNITTANMLKNGKLYFNKAKNSKIITNLKKADKLTIFEENQDLTLVRSSQGYVGYVKTQLLGNKTTIPETEKEQKALWQPTNGKISMVFDQLTSINASSSIEKRTEIDNLDIICPTFFSFENTKGDIRNIADKSYIQWAHNQGYQVWALLTDNFDAATSRAVLTNDETRAYVIKQLLAYCSMYELDGINLDFESVPADCSQQWLQFVRELTPRLHQEGIIVSVDCFVPKPWTAQYMRKELAEVVDYIVVMGYDEHYKGSEESGSVASISWSREAITATLNQDVPKEKLILGVPFYTRIWTEENGKITDASSYSMNQAYSIMKEKNAHINWLENMGQYYGEATKNETTYKCWFEDARSIKERLQLVKEYDVAGVAGWKKGLEYQEIWSVINEEIKQ